MAISAATPYLVALPLTAGIVAAAVRRPWLAAGAVVTAGLLAATQLPLYVGGPALAGPSQPLRIVTSNMKYGHADPASLVELVRDGDVDVLFLQELTAHAVTRLASAGMGELLPYQVLRPGPRATGSGIYSRRPLTAIDAPDGFSNVVAVATLQVGGAAPAITVASVHPKSPWPGASGTWSDELERLAAWADGLQGPVVMAGDFNASDDHAQMRHFADIGYVDGGGQVGAGYLATYPSDEWYPPLLAIDHVLTRGGPLVAAIGSRTIRDTDHRALVATVAVPLPATAPA